MKNTKKNKIVIAAIECINEYGIANTTIRKIAAKAKMNSAAISYYFDSKDKLLEQALETTLQNAFDWSDYSQFENLPAKEKLINIYSQLMEGAITYRGIARAHYYDTFMTENYSTMAVIKVNDFTENIYMSIKDEFPDKTEQELKMVLTQLNYSTLISSGFMPGFFLKLTKETLENADYRNKYIRSLIEKLF